MASRNLFTLLLAVSLALLEGGAAVTAPVLLSARLLSTSAAFVPGSPIPRVSGQGVEGTALVQLTPSGLLRYSITLGGVEKAENWVFNPNQRHVSVVVLELSPAAKSGVSGSTVNGVVPARPGGALPATEGHPETKKPGIVVVPTPGRPILRVTLSSGGVWKKGRTVQGGPKGVSYPLYTLTGGVMLGVANGTFAGLKSSPTLYVLQVTWTPAMLSDFLYAVAGSLKKA